MYKTVYDKIALEDISKLKAANLDKYAKKTLIDILRIDSYKTPPPFE